jgi:hypothetical protein
MKIRTGFVSNSSGSNFILIYLPNDFDFDSVMESEMEKIKNKKKKNYYYEEIQGITSLDIDQLKKSGVCYEGENGQKFWGLYQFLRDYILFVEHEACHEGDGIIRLINKEIFDKMASIDNKNREINNKFKDVVSNKKIRREILKDKMKGINPYGEEQWDDDELKGYVDQSNESNKVKKFKEL